MNEFEVFGPFKIKYKQLASGRILEIDGFWESSKILQEYRSSKGVYIFGIKPSGGSAHIPYYVGKTTRSFEKEIFTERNQLKYTRVMANFKRGGPSLFLIIHPKNGSRPNLKHIKQIEEYFIAQGFAVNPEIENDRNIPKPKWSVSGVVRSKTTRPTNSAKSIMKAFRIEKAK